MNQMALWRFTSMTIKLGILAAFLMVKFLQYFIKEMQPFGQSIFISCFMDFFMKKQAGRKKLKNIMNDHENYFSNNSLRLP